MSRPPVEPEQEVGPFDFVDDDETRAALEDYLVELRDRQGRSRQSPHGALRSVSTSGRTTR